MSKARCKTRVLIEQTLQTQGSGQIETVCTCRVLAVALATPKLPDYPELVFSPAPPPLTSAPLLTSVRPILPVLQGISLERFFMQQVWCNEGTVSIGIKSLSLPSQGY
jgi:hypothetical protein